jgi:hypothetical protein
LNWNNNVINVEGLAEEQCHRVLWKPPYHSDLQPIELLWARVKGNVGRQYNKQTNLSVVKQRLEIEFANLAQPEGKLGVENMIESCARTTKQFYDSMDNEFEEDDVALSPDNKGSKRPRDDGDQQDDGKQAEFFESGTSKPNFSVVA